VGCVILVVVVSSQMLESVFEPDADSISRNPSKGHEGRRMAGSSFFKFDSHIDGAAILSILVLIFHGSILRHQTGM
jgi:hypothetical protein